MEFIPESAKDTVTTLIMAYDASNMFFLNFFLLKFSRDIQDCFTFFFLLDCTAFLILILLIPESPHWLFIKKGSNSQRAIQILNYIGSFNGSQTKVPEDAFFDLMGQVIEEH